MEGVDRGARRCGIQSVEQGCVEGIWSRVQGEILRDMRESMRERDHWLGRGLSTWRTAGGKGISGGITCYMLLFADPITFGTLLLLSAF